MEARRLQRWSEGGAETPNTRKLQGRVDLLMRGSCLGFFSGVWFLELGVCGNKKEGAPANHRCPHLACILLPKEEASFQSFRTSTYSQTRSCPVIKTYDNRILNVSAERKS